ncbi:MAG: tetratricopeptide repeat protein [Candidatus Zixiibacteriota bacterium]
MIGKKIQIILGIALVSIAIFLVFQSGISGDFLLWDDVKNVVKNTSIHSLDIGTLKWAFTNPHLGVWEPLSFILKAIIIDFFEINAKAFKIVSIALHIINTLLLGILIQMIMQIIGSFSKKPNLRRLSIFIVLLFFALSPLRVSTVTWISCQPYLLCAFFCLLSIIFYLKYAIRNGPRSFHPYLWLSLLAFIFAGMSKAVSMTLPVVLILIDIYPLNSIKKSPLKTLLDKVPFFMMSFFIAGTAYWARNMFTYFEPLSKYNILHRIMISAHGLVFYIQRSIIPFEIAPFYPLPGSKYLPNADSMVFFSLPFIISLILVIIVILILVLRWRFDGLVVAIIAYAVILSPNLGLTISGVNLVADRYSYIAMMPLYIAFSVLLYKLLKTLVHLQKARKIMIFVFFALILTLNIVSSLETLQYWQNDKNFWRRIIITFPDCPDSYYILGSLHASNGYKNKNRHDLLLAEQFLAKANEKDIQEGKIDYKLGFVQSELKRFEKAEKSFEKYLADRPDDALAHIRYGDMLLEIGRLEDVLYHFETSVVIDSSLAKIHKIPSKLQTLKKQMSPNSKDSSN